MKIVGLTGNMGTGKSEVLKLFDNYRFTIVLKCDDISKSIILHKSFKNTVKSIFGDSVLTNSKVDLSKLRNVIFDDKEKLNKLENILYPIIWKKIQATLCYSRCDLAIIEAALLFEKNWQDKFDSIIVTSCLKTTQYKRLVINRCMEPEDVAKRLSYQWEQDKLLKLANYKIDTDCSKEELKAKVEEVHKRLYDDLPKIGPLYH